MTTAAIKKAAAEQRRQGRLLSSRALARAVANGAGTDGTIEKTLAEGEARAPGSAIQAAIRADDSSQTANGGKADLFAGRIIPANHQDKRAAVTVEEEIDAEIEASTEVIDVALERAERKFIAYESEADVSRAFLQIIKPGMTDRYTTAGEALANLGLTMSQARAQAEKDAGWGGLTH